MARVDLGLSGREFGRLSYRALGALINRYNVRRRIEDFRFGQICAMIGNAAGGKKGQPFQPSDFFISLKETVKPPSAKALHAWADLMNTMQNVRAEIAAKSNTTP